MIFFAVDSYSANWSLNQYKSLGLLFAAASLRKSCGMCLVMVIDPIQAPANPNVLAVCNLSARFRYCHLSRAEVVGAPDNQPFSMLSLPAVSRLLVQFMRSNRPPRRVPAPFRRGPVPSSGRFVASRFQTPHYLARTAPR